MPQQIHSKEVGKVFLNHSLTSPATAAVVVAMAGTIRPAIRFIFSRSAVSIPYMAARKFCTSSNQSFKIATKLYRKKLKSERGNSKVEMISNEAH